ncbi:MAG: hypothetical protein IH849_02605 [Acidobacteria bacterium]|nr:hypothetical protein [Acidobacteriota bacterium]
MEVRRRLLLHAPLVRGAASTFALLLVFIPMAAGAWLAFPYWDDGWLWLLLRESGVQAIAPSYADRPVNAALWRFVAGSAGGIWTASFVAHFLLWPLLGIASALLFRKMYPSQGHLAPLVACVAIAPVFHKVGLATANIALVALPAVLLVYAALLLLLRFIATQDAVAYRWFGGALPLVGAASLLNEYGVAAALACVSLLAVVAAGSSGDERRRAASATAALLCVAGIGYATYLAISDYATTRPDVHPARAVEMAEAEFFYLPFRFLGALWSVSIGAFGAAVANLSFLGRAGAGATLYGGIAAALVVIACSPFPAYPTETAEIGPMRVRAIASLAALLAAIAAVVLMGRDPWQEPTHSRFVIPVLPILAGLTAVLASGLLRGRQLSIAVALIGFVCASSAFSEGWSALREHKMMEIIGERLEAEVAAEDGITVAVLSLPPRQSGDRYEWELTARIGADWPDTVRRRFWAFDARREIYYEDDIGTRGRCRDTREVSFDVRLVERKGRIASLLWVRPDAYTALSKLLAGEMDVLVEPYCVGTSLADHHEPGGMPSSAHNPEHDDDARLASP